MCAVSKEVLAHGLLLSITLSPCCPTSLVPLVVAVIINLMLICVEQFTVWPLYINERDWKRTWTFISFRTLNGLGILVCSMDGSVAFLDFSQDELGDPLSEEEKVQ